MATINMVPEFTKDTPLDTPKEQEVVGESPTEATESQPDEVEEEKETPAEPPAEQQPAGHTSQDTGEDEREQAIQALKEERVKLLRDIADLRGQRREIKQEQIDKVTQQIDELKDIAPEDVAVIEKVLRSKGYVRQDEVKTMYYESIKTEELNRFLESHPEYKPENDPSDLNWSSLQKELGFYKMPDNPRLVGEVLLRAHRARTGSLLPSDRNIAIKKEQLKTASVGGGGVQRSSSKSGKTLTPDQRRVYEDGGWSEEEIRAIENKLK